MKDNPLIKRSKTPEDSQKYLIQVIGNFSQLIKEVLNNKGKQIFVGNGGSAVEAQHMAAECLGTLMTQNKRKSIPSIVLSTDSFFGETAVSRKLQSILGYEIYSITFKEFL